MPDTLPFPKRINTRKRGLAMAEQPQHSAATPLRAMGSISPNSFDYIFQAKPSAPVTPPRADTMTPCSSPSVSRGHKSSASAASHTASFADKREHFKTPIFHEPAIKAPEITQRRSARQMLKAEEMERERLIEAIGELHKDYKFRHIKSDRSNVGAKPTADLCAPFQPVPKRPRGAAEDLLLREEDIIQHGADLKAAANIAVELSENAKAACSSLCLEGLFRWHKNAVRDDKEAGTSVKTTWIPDSIIPVPAARVDLSKGNENQLQSRSSTDIETPAPQHTFQFDDTMDLRSFAEHIGIPPPSYDDVPMINNTNPGTLYLDELQSQILSPFGGKSDDSETPLSGLFPSISAFAKPTLKSGVSQFDCDFTGASQALQTPDCNDNRYSFGSNSSIATCFQLEPESSQLPPLPETCGPHNYELGDMALLNENNTCLPTDSRFKMDDCLEFDGGDDYLNFGVDDALLGLPEAGEIMLNTQ